MKRYIKSNSDLQTKKYFLDLKAGGKYYVNSQIDEARSLMWGYITKVAPYDEAEYFWAKLFGNGSVEFIRNGKIEDKMQLWSYEEDEYDNLDAYFDDIATSVAEELARMNKNIKPVMSYN